jgi:hypothetical protein
MVGSLLGCPIPLWHHMERGLVATVPKSWQGVNQPCYIGLTTAHGRSATWWLADHTLPLKCPGEVKEPTLGHYKYPLSHHFAIHTLYSRFPLVEAPVL